MFKEQSAPFSMSQLLEQLQKNGLISQENCSAIEKNCIHSDQAVQVPIYLRGLMILGALLFSIFFIGFLLFADIFTVNDNSLIFFGIMFTGFAVFLYQSLLKKGDKNSLSYYFSLQTSFNFMILGKIAFVIGCAEAFDHAVHNIQWGISGALLFITLITYPLYSIDLDRLLSTAATLIAISLSIAISFEQEPAWQNILLSSFFLLQVITVAILYVHNKVNKQLEPVSYAIIAAILFQVILWTLVPKKGELSYLLVNIQIIKAILVVTLIVLIGWLAGSIEKLRQEPIIMAILGTIALGIVSSATIICALILLVLGYAKHDNLLIISGILSLPVFIFFYYYYLEITLFDKSMLLIGSGVILLSGYFYIKLRQFESKGE